MVAQNTSKDEKVVDKPMKEMPVTLEVDAAKGDTSPRKFTASVGDTKGKQTKFDIVCHQCTLDFK